MAQLFASGSKERRAIGACNRCRVRRVKIICLCCIISLFSYILRVRFGGRVRLKPREKHVPASQIIEGWANHDSLYRSRLYIPYFQTIFVLFRSWILFGFQPRALFPFFTFHDEKLTRLNVRKNKGLKCEVKSCLTRNVARNSPFNGKHNKTFFTFMTGKILSLRTKQFIWFNVVHSSYPIDIPATPQRL